ncbi:hypothetical protein OJF2_66920 [Aquisphaera giovannonii]|uniref:Uncharacterized protein n=1 Tax=Aquisphaera giovannonii TaxID=406548 RepID=A0A5B9WCU0_9BACT|nr:hypothetical protein [Aquisphaera giovannonii]QEH38094.1 hypothetical protein OJF2_66920 [Aquisphaera giovannonii]
MKPLFVRFKGGRRRIAWIKLFAFCTLVVALTAAAFEGGWYLISGRTGLGPVLASLVPSMLIVCRAVAQTLSYQYQESLEESPVGTA